MVVEELSKVCASTGVVVSAHSSLCCDPIYRYGTEEQKQKFLPPLLSGQMLGCLGLTETQAGTDAANLKTTAVLDGDQWVLNGSKIFITNGGPAGMAVVIAVTDKAAGAKGLSAFIVPTDTPGYKVAKEEHKLGIRACSTAELVFDDCRIPKENLLGKAGEGLQDRAGDPRRRPHRHRRPGARHRPGRLRRGHGLRQGARAVRQADLELSRRSSGSSPTWPPRSTPRGCSSTAPPG